MPPRKVNSGVLASRHRLDGGAPLKLPKIPDVVLDHPYLTGWVVLAVGMVLILLLTSGEAHLLPQQLLFLILVTVALAGACVWIVSWDETA